MDEIKRRIINVFDKMFPKAFCELNYRNHFELLVAVILSAQTTDKAVNKVTKNLFQKFSTPEEFACASVEAIENEIKHLGLYKNKAKNIKKMSQMLIKQYYSKIPDTMDLLIKLPGVGRKTANVMLSEAFSKSAFAVDTHVERVSKRLQIAEETDSLIIVERKLNAYFPEELWSKLHHQMIFFGRYHCLARNPKCNICDLKNVCKYYIENKI